LKKIFGDLWVFCHAEKYGDKKFNFRKFFPKRSYRNQNPPIIKYYTVGQPGSDKIIKREMLTIISAS
jgi:hypothetical protein